MYQLDTYQTSLNTVTGSKLRSLRLSYNDSGPKAVGARSLKYALRYVLHKLNFQPAFMIDPDTRVNSEKILLQDQTGSDLLLEIEKLPAETDLAGIVFYTDNCLRDYHKYITLGVEFTSRPQYCEHGLKVEFLAPDDSVYTLLEKRSYSEDSVS